jgi:hypothetical protein
MIDHAEPAMGAAVTSMSAGTVAPSCYRVSVVSGSLEVTARLKNADDLDLLMNVLEANNGLFVNASPNEAFVRSDRSENPFSKEDRSQIELLVKAQSPEIEGLGEPNGKATKNGAKPNRSAKQSVEADSSEDILTLT